MSNPSVAPESITQPPSPGEPQSPTDALDALLGQVRLPERARILEGHSGASVILRAQTQGDTLEIVSAKGSLLLHATITAEKVSVRMDAPNVTLHASETLTLAAPSIAIAATKTLRLACDHSIHIEGETLDAQASGGDLRLRAMGDIALDGDLIGLNNLSQPTPFPWSTISKEVAQ